MKAFRDRLRDPAADSRSQVSCRGSLTGADERVGLIDQELCWLRRDQRMFPVIMGTIEFDSV
jgi:hypothetical protein